MDEKKMIVVSLRGEAKYTRLLSGTGQTQGMRSGLVHLRPNEEIGPHSTEAKEEALVLMQGKAEISCDKGVALAVEAPSVIYIPAQTMHNVKNTGTQLLRYVYVVAPVTL